jgi:hypothetical protein
MSSVASTSGAEILNVPSGRVQTVPRGAAAIIACSAAVESAAPVGSAPPANAVFSGFQ